MRGAIFDLDGTLLDTSEGIINSVTYMTKKLGYTTPDDDMLKTFIGPPIKERMMQLYDISESEALQAHLLFRKNYSQNNIFKAKRYDGINELLAGIHANGIKLGVATYKREDQAILLLQKFGLDKYFNAIHGADAEGRYSKTDIIEMCINELKINRKEIVMIGDSDSDAIGARNIGIKFLAVTYGFGFKTENSTKKYPNIGVASNCKQIYNILFNIK